MRIVVFVFIFYYAFLILGGMLIYNFSIVPEQEEIDEFENLIFHADSTMAHLQTDSTTYHTRTMRSSSGNGIYEIRYYVTPYEFQVENDTFGGSIHHDDSLEVDSVLVRFLPEDPRDNIDDDYAHELLKSARRSLNHTMKIIFIWGILFIIPILIGILFLLKHIFGKKTPPKTSE